MTVAVLAEPLFPQITHPKKRAFLAAFVELGTVTRAAKVAAADGVLSKNTNASNRLVRNAL